jgi:PAS domain S-box-containing protein
VTSLDRPTPDAAAAPAAAFGTPERYRWLIERIPAAVYVQVDAEPQLTTYLSPRIEHLLGYPAQTLDRATWISLIHDDDRERVLAAEHRADETKQPFLEEFRMRTADGRIVWIRDHAEWVPPSGDEPAHWFGFFTDVTEHKRLEEELRETGARYRTLVEQLPAVTYVDLPDEAMTNVYVSPQLREMFGIGGEGGAVEIAEWSQRVHPADRERATRESLAGIEAGGRFSIEYRMVRADGKVLWIRDVATVLKDEQGRPTMVQGVLFDITEQKELEQELRETAARFRTLVEQIPAVVYVDPLEPEPVASIYVSPYVETMLGVTPDHATSHREWWPELVHAEDRDEAVRISDDATRLGTPYRNEYRVVRPDGRLVWVRDEAVLVRDERGQALFWQGVMFDITDRKRAEQELTQALELERAAVDRLREADEMKDTFLTAVSHDLRTPLSTILGIAVTLEQEEHVPLDPVDRRDLLRSLGAKARQLTDLVTDLLDLERLRRGASEPKVTEESLDTLVAELVAGADLGDVHPIELELAPVRLPVDRTMVGRIVENLLANAVRHTPPGTRVWVRLSEDAQGGALLVVEDDGPGIPAELREALFRPFERGPSANPQSPGTGVGLSLVARFAELHGGRAWVEERDGGGASFRVWLPGGGPRAAGPASG